MSQRPGEAAKRAKHVLCMALLSMATHRVHILVVDFPRLTSPPAILSPPRCRR